MRLFIAVNFHKELRCQLWGAARVQLPELSHRAESYDLMLSERVGGELTYSKLYTRELTL